MKELENKFISTITQILTISCTDKKDFVVILDKLNISAWLNFIEQMLSDPKNSRIIKGLQIDNKLTREELKRMANDFVSELSINNYDCIDMLRKSYLIILHEFVTEIGKDLSNNEVAGYRKIISNAI